MELDVRHEEGKRYYIPFGDWQTRRSDMQFDIQHDETSRKYTAQSNGQEVGLLTYYPVGEGVIDFTHTYVPPEHRGHGIAEQLVEHALNETLRRGLRFRASCWYVDAFVRRHSRYQQAFAHA